MTINKFRFHYSVSSHLVMTILGKTNLKTEFGPVPETKCILFKYIRWKTPKISGVLLL